MKPIAFAFTLLAVLVSFGRLTGKAQAQFSADYQTNIISGVASNWPGNYYVGSNTVFDLLQIDSGGSLTNGTGWLGYESNALYNSALITGSGSVWKCNGDLYVGNSGGDCRLVIENSGVVYNS